jgi:type VI secretion system protein VasD
MGCGKPKIPQPQPPIKIAVEGIASPTINRDANGDPLSVVIRIYHLKDKAEFSKLTFDMVTSGRTDQELLGADYLGKSELVIVPGNTYCDTTDLAPGTKYIGVVAFFRKPDSNYWRYLVSMDQLNLARTRKKDWHGLKLPLFSFKVDDCFMTIPYSKPEFIPGQPENAKPECSGYPVYAPAQLATNQPTATVNHAVGKPAVKSKSPQPLLQPIASRP